MRILVVEDERQVGELIQRALESLGNTCFLARSAHDADLVLEQRQVDGVTLDLGMPDRGGLEWLEAVATSRPELARRTLVITGQVLDGDAVVRVARCGAGVLIKPFTLEGLAAAIDSQLRPGAP